MVCDPGGHYRFTDRMKDSIRGRGENVPPCEVEQAIQSHGTKHFRRNDTEYVARVSSRLLHRVPDGALELVELARQSIEPIGRESCQQLGQP